MRWRGLLVVAALALSACAFGSEEPLFADRDGVRLFGENETLMWNERPEGEAFRVSFTRDGAGYLMRKVDESSDPPIRVLFVPIRETPEDDYVAQVQLGRDGADGVAYAFVWRNGHGYRVFADPRAFDGGAPAEASRYCQAVGQGECHFASRADLIGYYRTIVHPRFVRGGGAPQSYLDLTHDFPNDGAGLPERPRK